MVKRYTVVDRHGRETDLEDDVVPDGYSLRVPLKFADQAVQAMHARAWPGRFVDAAGRAAGHRPGFVIPADRWHDHYDAEPSEQSLQAAAQARQAWIQRVSESWKGRPIGRPQPGLAPLPTTGMAPSSHLQSGVGLGPRTPPAIPQGGLGCGPGTRPLGHGPSAHQLESQMHTLAMPAGAYRPNVGLSGRGDSADAVADAYEAMKARNEGAWRTPPPRGGAILGKRDNAAEGMVMAMAPDDIQQMPMAQQELYCRWYNRHMEENPNADDEECDSFARRALRGVAKGDARACEAVRDAAWRAMVDRTSNAWRS